MSSMPAIDWPLCLKLALNKEDIAREMLDRIVASLPDERQNLLLCHQDQSYDGLQARAHRLHGACCYSGLPALKIAAKNLEIAINNGLTREYDSLYQQLVKAIDEVIHAYSDEYQEAG